jgi:hypothetical protein
MISRLLKWIGIVLGVLILAVVLFLSFFDLYRLRGPLSTMVSDKLERRFAIRGDLDVAWSWTPKLTINDIELDNASWGSRSEMFTLDRAEVSLRIPDLFKGHLVLPEIWFLNPGCFWKKMPKARPTGISASHLGKRRKNRPGLRSAGGGFPKSAVSPSTMPSSCSATLPLIPSWT